MAEINIVVVGAGVSGLTTALLLVESCPFYSITVAAKHMPGDLDSVEYASPWAGANFMPVGERGSQEAKFEKDTFPYLFNLAKNKPEAGVHFQVTKILNRAKDKNSPTGKWFSSLTDTSPWWKDTVIDYKQISSAELPSGIDSASQFTSVVLNTPHYLHYLVSRLLALGVTFKRVVLSHLLDANKVHHSGKPAQVIVNCTALGSRFLGGVKDDAMVPARGQTVLVRNSAPFQGCISGSDDREDEVTYLMTRAVAGGTIMGGCYQKGNWDGAVDAKLGERILKRVVDFCPELTKDGPLDIISHNVGLRPVREGGFRVERELIEGNDGNKQVVHNYGHGGAGYQTSYGCALKVVQLVVEAVEQLGPQVGKSKL